MSEGDINIFDAVVVAIMALSSLIAFFRGLVREVLSLVAWIGAGIVTFYYFPSVIVIMQGYFKSDVMAVGASTVGLYIVALMGFAILNMLILKTIRRSGESDMLDNMLGLIFGAARGVFIISLGFFLITTVIPEDEYPDWIAQAASLPYAQEGAKLLARLAPDSLQNISSLQKEALEKAQERIELEQQDIEYDDGREGYSRRTTGEFDDNMNDDMDDDMDNNIELAP